MRLRLRQLPACTISGLLTVGFGVLLWLLVTQTVADADLWGHLRFGLDLLHTHRLPVWDTYSFTADRMWVNHEWLAELSMATAYRLAGPLGLNLLKVLAIAAIATIVIRVARWEGAAPADQAVLVILVVLSTYTRTQVIRPQLLSVVLFCALLYALRQAERGRHGALIFVPVCFALWVNLHGAWILGLACCMCWLIAEAWTRRDVRGLIVAVCVGAVAATLLNPYGTGMWTFLAETVRPDRADITDWKPLADLPVAIIVLDLLLPAVAVCSIVGGRQRVRWRHLAIIGLLAWGTWRVGRVDAFLEAAIGILLAPQILDGFRSLRARLQSRIWRVEVPFGRAAASAAATVALVAGLLQLRTIEIEGAWLPDASGLESVRRSCAGQNVLTWFDWGEYAIWHLSPAGIRVSLDGRRETVYSERVLNDHAAFFHNQVSAVDYPERIAAECVWLPARFSTVGVLEARGWTVVWKSDKSAVLRRSAPVPSTPVTAVAAQPRRFPGP
jgi:hypothetical protein